MSNLNSDPNQEETHTDLSEILTATRTVVTPQELGVPPTQIDGSNRFVVNWWERQDLLPLVNPPSILSGSSQLSNPWWSNIPISGANGARVDHVEGRMGRDGNGFIYDNALGMYDLSQQLLKNSGFDAQIVGTGGNDPGFSALPVSTLGSENRVSGRPNVEVGLNDNGFATNTSSLQLDSGANLPIGAAGNGSPNAAEEPKDVNGLGMNGAPNFSGLNNAMNLGGMGTVGGIGQNWNLPQELGFAGFGGYGYGWPALPQTNMPFVPNPMVMNSFGQYPAQAMGQFNPKKVDWPFKIDDATHRKVIKIYTSAKNLCGKNAGDFLSNVRHLELWDRFLQLEKKEKARQVAVWFQHIEIDARDLSEIIGTPKDKRYGTAGAITALMQYPKEDAMKKIYGIYLNLRYFPEIMGFFWASKKFRRIFEEKYNDAGKTPLWGLCPALDWTGVGGNSCKCTSIRDRKMPR